MPDRPDAARLAAWRAFLTAHAALTEALEAELRAERDLSLPWYDVLVQLSEAPAGAMRMQDLARSTLLSKSGLTRLVDRMEQAGLVERRPCPDDQRGRLAVLTTAGRAALRRAAPVHLRGVEEHFARHLTDAEVALLHAALGNVLAALGRPAMPNEPAEPSS
ncbi:MAG: MarR family transcriptional regulator [Dehalococcoidia bacterium]